MSPVYSKLSLKEYGYDFVVATTQESLNEGLREYLYRARLPETFVCFLADETGNPARLIALSELMTRTNGVNPFEIPANTPYDDPRIAALNRQKFVVGLKLRMGLPPGVRPTALTILDLGASADNVSFKLFCSEFVIVRNTPPGASHAGSWNVWSQPSGAPWSFAVKVRLVFKDLDKALDTPYFRNHPEQKQALLRKLENLKAGAFSLQQLLFDLSNAVLESVPTIDGLGLGSPQYRVLSESFTTVYFDCMKDHGEPVLSVHAVANGPDQSSLTLTSMEREVSQVVDAHGNVIPDPTQEQKRAATLSWLCATGGNPLPPPARFTWNWVEPGDLGNASGIVAINRNTLGRYYANLLIPHVSRACFKPTAAGDDRHLSLVPGQTPTIKPEPIGDDIVYLEYQSKLVNPARLKTGAGDIEIEAATRFMGTVRFARFPQAHITIVQHLTIWARLRFESFLTEGNLVNRFRTDTFTLSVDEFGGLRATAGVPAVEDHPDQLKELLVESSREKFVAVVNEIRSYAASVAGPALQPVEISEISNFVFPGGQVFAYKDVDFSPSYDLLASITFVRAS